MSDLSAKQSGQTAVSAVNAPGQSRGLHGRVLLSGFIKALQLLLGVGASLLLARWLGAAGYGAYSFALALATLLAVPAQLGWPTLLTREVARSQGEGDLGRLRGVLRISVSWTFASSLVMVALGLLVAIWIGTRGEGQDVAALLIGCALISPLAWSGLCAAALRGMDRVLMAQLPDGVLRPALFLLLMSGAFVWGRLSPTDAMIAQVVAVLGSVVFGSIVLKRVLPTGMRHAVPDTTDALAWRRSLCPLMFVSAAQIVTAQADLLVLGMISDTRTVGIYKVAVMIGMQVGFATWLVNAVFAPRIVHLHRVGHIAGLRALMRKGIRYVMAIAVPAAIGIVVFGRWALDLFLGPEYLDAYWPMVIIGVGQLLGITAGPVGILLAMTGHERDVARVMAIATVISVVLTLLLASVYGAIGAALATAFAMVLTRYLLKRVVARNFPALATRLSER